MNDRDTYKRLIRYDRRQKYVGRVFIDNIDYARGDDDTIFSIPRSM